MTARTNFGVLGLVVGWDLAFPEACRSLALEGAESICVCGSWEATQPHEWRCGAARAYENAVFLAAPNRGGDEPTYSCAGESMILGPRGTARAGLANREPGVAFATVDSDEVRYRQDEM